MKLTLKGFVPSKKNLLRRSKNGGMYRKADVVCQIDWLTLQAANQWIGKSVEYPVISMHFVCADYRRDLDNMGTTILDCLQKAGVIVNDNLKHLRHLTLTGEKGHSERVEIEIEAATR